MCLIATSNYEGSNCNGYHVPVMPNRIFDTIFSSTILNCLILSFFLNVLHINSAFSQMISCDNRPNMILENPRISKFTLNFNTPSNSSILKSQVQFNILIEKNDSAKFNNFVFKNDNNNAKIFVCVGSEIIARLYVISNQTRPDFTISFLISNSEYDRLQKLISTDSAKISIGIE